MDKNILSVTSDQGNPNHSHKVVHPPSLEWPPSKRQKDNKLGKDRKKGHVSFTVSRRVKWQGHYRAQHGTSFKSRSQSCATLLALCSVCIQRTANGDVSRYLHSHAHYLYSQEFKHEINLDAHPNEGIKKT